MDVALRNKCGGLPKSPGNSPWQQILIMVRLPAFELPSYRTSSSAIAETQRPFFIPPARVTRSHKSELKQVSIELPSEYFHRIQAWLVSDLKQPLADSLQARGFSHQKQLHIIGRIFDHRRARRPRVEIKYHCSSDEADRLVEEINAECRNGIDYLMAIGLSLMHSHYPDHLIGGASRREDSPFRAE